MPAPSRLLRGVLVLSPGAVNDPQCFQLGRAAMRVAYLQQLAPVYPLAYCMTFMTQEEISRRLRETTMWWYRRVAQIWLCFTQTPAEGLNSSGNELEGYPELDPLSHDILLINEGLMAYPDGGRGYLDKNRLSVYRFQLPVLEDGPPIVERVDRGVLAHYLRCNLTGGLLRGMAEE
jgi:hypothetical protein